MEGDVCGGGQFLRAQLLIVSCQLQQSGAYYLVSSTVVNRQKSYKIKLQSLKKAKAASIFTADDTLVTVK